MGKFIAYFNYPSHFVLLQLAHPYVMHRLIGHLRRARIKRRFSLLNGRDEKGDPRVPDVDNEREKSRFGFVRRDEKCVVHFTFTHSPIYLHVRS